MPLWFHFSKRRRGLKEDLLSKKKTEFIARKFDLLKLREEKREDFFFLLKELNALEIKDIYSDLYSLNRS